MNIYPKSTIRLLAVTHDLVGTDAKDDLGTDATDKSVEDGMLDSPGEATPASVDGNDGGDATRGVDSQFDESLALSRT